MDDRAAGEVESAHLGHPAAAPDPVGHGTVDDQQPQGGEEQEAGEFDALGKRAGDQRRGDDGKHALEDHEGQVRDVVDPFLGRLSDAVKEGKVEVADDAADVAAKGQAVAHDGPQHGHGAEQDVGVHERAKDVLGADHAAVEKSQARRHEHDQGRRNEHESGICRVHGSPSDDVFVEESSADVVAFSASSSPSRPSPRPGGLPSAASTPSD